MAISLSSSSSFLSPLPVNRSASHARISFFKNTSLLLSLRCSNNLDSDSQTYSSAADFTNKLSASIGGIGLLETTYLTYLNLTNSEAFCPIGGGSCSDVLNSDFALLFVSVLWEHVKRNGVKLPEFVYDHDEDLEHRPYMDYGLESDHHRASSSLDSPLSTYSMRCIS